ncbi:MAG: signal recognition particle-docking protein FtsY [Clostridiaceae bacterium]|nr:signal recognition particle-docking protein FtsY [Clostridiaceae bacterium]
MNFLNRLKNGLGKTRQQFSSRTADVLKLFSKIDDALFEELEEVLIMSDIGFETSGEIVERLRQKAREEKIRDPETLQKALEAIVLDMMGTDDKYELRNPTVMLITGVNGVGKTTSIGKLAHYYKEQGKQVIIAAADTFRAAASEQLEVWANRAGVKLVMQQEGSDPASVVYDAISAAKARGADLLICDTAGRLHNKQNLMNELAKINRVIDREFPDAQKEVLLVLDATTGQNALSQAKSFTGVADVNGIILTKLDGTAKGGIVIAIKKEQNIPVRFIGIGEGMDDLQPFSPSDFVNALFDRQ